MRCLCGVKGDDNGGGGEKKQREKNAEKKTNAVLNPQLMVVETEVAEGKQRSKETVLKDKKKREERGRRIVIWSSRRNSRTNCIGHGEANGDAAAVLPGSSGGSVNSLKVAALVGMAAPCIPASLDADAMTATNSLALAYAGSQLNASRSFRPKKHRMLQRP